jgi:hypothetical protein
MGKTKTKRILFDTTPELYQEIKIHALKSNMSLKTYVIRAILEQVLRDNKNEEDIRSRDL